MSATERMSIVIDNGSGSIKAGFGGQDLPTVELPSLFATRSISTDLTGEILVGKEAKINTCRQIYRLRYPIENGVITNWDAMEKIWQYTFKELNVETVDCPVLLTEPPCNPKENSEKMTQLMFETFKVPSMYASVSSVLSLFATGRYTGIVFDSGDGSTNVVPVYEGHALEHNVSRMYWAGRDLDCFLSRILSERGWSLCTREELDIVRKIKEELCYVALDFEQEMSNGITDVDFELPDGNIITIGNERFRCPEVYFQPHFLGIEEAGIQQTIVNTIGKCDLDIRNELYRNIILSGGSTMFKGIGHRLHNELTQLAPYSVKISVIDNYPEHRKNLAWIGGSILSSMTSFQNNWIIPREYEEVGNSIIHRKCF